MNEVSVLIPLYKSRRHLEHVLATVDDHIARGASVLLSDQHHLDDAADVIRERFAGDRRVRVFVSDQGGNWVENVNLLMAAVETETFRIVPHDDTAPATGTERLYETFRMRPDAVLCHGYVRAEDMEGTRLPERDEPNLPLFPPGLERAFGPLFSMGFFWSGYFNGSFKALIRTESVQSRGVYIRRTPTLVHSERAWLFALSLLGTFVFEPAASMRKRYWVGSLTDGWSWGSPEILDVARIMESYVDDLVEDPSLRLAMRFNINLNAMNWARWLDGTIPTRPPFDMTVPVSSLG